MSGKSMALDLRKKARERNCDFCVKRLHQPADMRLHLNFIQYVSGGDSLFRE